MLAAIPGWYPLPMANAATDQAIRLLIDERDRLDQAIRLLQGGAAGVAESVSGASKSKASIPAGRWARAKARIENGAPNACATPSSLRPQGRSCSIGSLASACKPVMKTVPRSAV